MISKLINGIFLTVGSLLLVSAASAAEISVNGTIVLSDDYDAPPAEVLPGAPPIADIGEWTEAFKSTISDAVSPGSFQGYQYLHMEHDGTPYENCTMLHTLASPAAAPGDVVRVEMMAYIPSDYAGETAWFQFVGFDTSGVVVGVNNSPLHTCLFDNMIRWYDGTGYNESTTFIAFDTWQMWEIEYTIGSATWSWLVDGVGDTNLGFNSNAADTGIGSLRFFCNQASAGHPIYLDAVSGPEPGAIDCSGAWQFFIDDYLVEDLADITRTLHQPVKDPGNPVLTPSGAWEANPYLYGTVIYDEDESIYKMWYMSYNYGEPLAVRTVILYATSEDGVNWIKPNLGLFSFNGSTDNNIVLTIYGYHDMYNPSVVEDPLDPDPDRLYKMIWWDFVTAGNAGLCVAFSPDGIHWTKYAGNPALPTCSAQNCISDVMDVMYDADSGKFVVYAKGWAEPFPNYRNIVRTESTDFINWSEPQLVIDHAHTYADPQSYGMPVFQYESVYLGLMRSYKNPGDETIDIQLTISHNNVAWQRAADMATFLPLGSPGSWDDGMVFTAPPILRGDTIEIYYGGWDGPHNSSNRHARIGVARLRKDGFVSLDAEAATGTVTTKKLTGVPGPLRVNYDATGGWLKVAVLDEAGEVIPGYGLDDCDVLDGDSLDQVVTWGSVGSLPDQEPLRFQFAMQNASLYSFAGESEYPGDVDGDGDVDLADLAELLAAYGSCTGDANYNPDADLDDSGCVDLSDLAMLLAHYGEGT